MLDSPRDFLASSGERHYESVSKTGPDGAPRRRRPVFGSVDRSDADSVSYRADDVSTASKLVGIGVGDGVGRS
jgi:hypothetical protein